MRTMEEIVEQVRVYSGVHRSAILQSTSVEDFCFCCHIAVVIFIKGLGSHKRPLVDNRHQ